MNRPKVSAESLLRAMRIINKKLAQAMNAKGPGILVNQHETLGILTEEYHELVMAVRRGHSEDIVGELADIAVCAIWGIASREETR